MSPSEVRRLVQRRSFRRSLAAGAGLAVAASALLLARPDGAAGEDDAGSLAPISVLAPDPSLDPRLLALELRGGAWTRAIERLDDALFARNEARRAHERTSALLDSLRDDRRFVRRDLSDASRGTVAVIAELEEVREVVRAQAVDLFVNHGADDLTAVDSVTADTEARRGRDLAREAAEVTLAQQAELTARLTDLEAAAELLSGRLRDLDMGIASASTALAELRDLLAELDEEVPAATAAVVRARRSASIVGLDIPVVALDAYLAAEDLHASDSPSCRLRWWMVAGVARIESRHGTIGGRTLRADGRPSRPIYGIPLDGRPGVREILDTDEGRLDGDTVHDRAVGPMQFIPETWSRRARDADGDGRADPQSIYDAAYSTGRYLCALGGDLADTTALRRAYFGYNTSTEYVHAVHEHARRYADFSLPSVENRVEKPGDTGD